jgi:hypothetical protein
MAGPAIAHFERKVFVCIFYIGNNYRVVPVRASVRFAVAYTARVITRGQINF